MRTIPGRRFRIAFALLVLLSALVAFAQAPAPPGTPIVNASLTPPTLISLSVSSGPVGTSVTLTGTTFSTVQGTSTVKFNGTTATPSSWSNTSITAPVPVGATTGLVIVTVQGNATSGITFTVTSSGGVGCSPTCLFQSSFTTAQGWTVDAGQLVGAATCNSDTTNFGGHQTGVNGFANSAPGTTRNSCDEVTTLANYPNGAGGRGHRHARANGVNAAGGGIALSWANTNEIWFRVMERWSAGFAWNAVHYAKDEYWNDLTTSFALTGIYNGVFGGFEIGGNAPLGTGLSWTQVYPGGISDGHWFCKEYHFNRTTGVVESWIDNIQYSNVTGVNFTSMTIGFGSLDTNNQSDVNCPTNDCYTDFDDYAVATGLSAGQRIGCL